MVLGQGNNPVIRKMVDEIMRARLHGVSRPIGVSDTEQGVSFLRNATRGGARIGVVDPSAT
jgi:hypothetical protein